MPTPLNLLILEDRPADAELMLDELRRAGFEPTWTRVDTVTDYLERLDASLDLILSDYSLPQFDGLRALKHLQASGLDIPFIVVTGSFEEMAVECMKQGAADYLVKDRLARLGPAVTRAIEERHARVMVRSMEKALRDSEERYRLITEHMSEALFFLDFDGRVHYANRRGVELTGYGPEDIGQQTIFDVMPAEMRETIQARLAAAAAGEALPSLATPLIRKDGTRFRVEVSAATVMKEGVPVGRLAVVRDVTEQWRAESDQRRSEARYRSLFENSRDSIIMVGHDGELLDLNSATLELFGGTRDEMLGTRVQELYVDPAERARFAEEIGRVGFVRDHPVTLKRKDGSKIDCLLTATAQRQGDDPALGHQTIIRDVTERNRIEAEMRQAQKMEAVGRLAGGIAHDFNNLLTVIIGRAQMSQSQLKPDDPGRKSLELIAKTAERAARLTRQLLIFSRKEVFQPAIIGLDSVVTGVATMLERVIGEDIELEFRLGPTTERVHADTGQIEQVLMNLIVNARDAMPRGGRLTVETGTVVLAGETARRNAGAHAGPYVTVAVTDTGTGIAPEVLTHIFEPFFTTKNPEKGTGLGLSTVYGIVTQHGGFIQVDSEPGRGTTFRIHLPVAA